MYTAICDLVVVSVCDGVWMYTSFFHFNKDSHSHDGKTPQTTELHHYPVAYLKAKEIKKNKNMNHTVIYTC